MNRRHIIALTVSLLFVVVMFTTEHFITYNQTPSSAPVGWYLNTYPTVHVGDVVKVCLPEAWGKLALARGYLQPTGICPGGAEPLIKIVTALSGDTVKIDRRMTKDTLGRPMPHFGLDSYTLGPDVIWLHGDARNSFDSRYFGPVPIGNVLAVLTPLGH